MASVQIIVKQTDGTILDDATAVMSDEALAFAIEAMASMRGWSEESGVGKPRWLTWELRKYAEYQVDLYAHKLAQEAAEAQAEAIKSVVVIQDGQ